MAGGKQYIALPVGEGPIVDELIVVFFVIGSKCPMLGTKRTWQGVRRYPILNECRLEGRCRTWRVLTFGHLAGPKSEAERLGAHCAIRHADPSHGWCDCFDRRV